jgi:hypothetical protein
MPDPPVPEEPILAHALEYTAEQLNRIDPTPFYSRAFSGLQSKINRYILDLIHESTQVAKRHRADAVSEAHIDTAADYWVSDTSRRTFRHLGTFGGILLGAGLSTLLARVTTKTYTGLDWQSG